MSVATVCENGKASIIGDHEVRPPCPVNPDAIPDQLQREDRWVGWKWGSDPKTAKWTKPPINAQTGERCNPTDSSNWSSLDDALAAQEDGTCDGIGFVLGDEDDIPFGGRVFAGVDLDDCRAPETGELTPLARDILNDLDTYAEVSPTGTGIKLLCLVDEGTLPEGHSTRNSAGNVEIYTGGRFFAVTGQDVDDSSSRIEERSGQLKAVWQKYVGSERQHAHSSSDPSMPLGLADGEADSATLEAMLRIQPTDNEADGSARLVKVAGRAVGHDLTDEIAIATIRAYEQTHPFPKEWSNLEICKRLRDVEKRIVRGSEKVIRVHHDIHRVVDEAVAALPRVDVYQKAGRLLRIERNPSKAEFAKKDNRAARLGLVPPGSMQDLLSKASRWQKRLRFNGEWVDCPPPENIARAVFNRRNYEGVPPVSEIVNRPILLRDGRIVADYGYSKETGLYIDIDGIYPTPMRTKEAVETLLDIFRDFPFDGDGNPHNNPNRSACIAALLTLLCRNVINGATPFFSFDGNRPGCGKGLATDVLTLIAEGREASRYPQADAKELRKALTAIALNGQTYILIDNIEGRFGGSVIECAITTSMINDRILGASEAIHVPLNITFLATANNATYSHDMPRRVCPVVINADEKPDMRSDFKYPRLGQHVRADRARLVMAGLSIVRNFILAGRPDQRLPRWGSFEEWSDLIRNAIVWAGLADPAETRHHVMAVGDSVDVESARTLVEAWQFEDPISAGEALAAVQQDSKKHSKLRDLLSHRPDHQSEAEYLGKLLRSAKGVRVDGRKFQNNGKKPPNWSIMGVDA